MRYQTFKAVPQLVEYSLLNKTPTNRYCWNRCLHVSSAALGSLPELTSVRYPGVKRGNYAELKDNHVSFFEGLLSSARVLSLPSDVESYNVDFLKMVRGNSRVVLKPKSTEEVSEILKFCNKENLAVCPQGGNTGLVGGSVPVFDEVIVSTSLMNQIISLDELSGVLVCQAGCILENLDSHASQQGLMMPLDLGAKGSCHIGGNISTNAGGIRLLRYGNLHGSVLGVEAVLASGEIVDCLSTLKKDNTGYHLKHLFIGSEGTLGFVTKVAIQCFTSPKAVNVAFLGVASFEDVLKTFKEAKINLGEILSSFEMIDAPSMDCVTTNLKLQSPIEKYPFYVLIETSGSNAAHDEEKLTSFLEKVMAEGLVKDGTAVKEPSHINHIWQIRERITEGLLCDGYVYKYDISTPLPKFYEIVPELTKHLADMNIIRCSGYGHVGDGNLHLNVTTKEFDKKVLSKIEPYVYEWTSKVQGSVSAEHGLGFKKKDFIHYSKSPSAIGVMKDLKKMLDPKGILNPYKMLP